MDRMTFGTKKLNTQRPRADRFVATRESFPEMSRRALWARQERRAVHIWDARYLYKKKYRNYLDEALGLEPLKAQGSLNADDEESLGLLYWPCRPRKKCYLSSTDSVLDLPMYRHAPFPELLDWSNHNILVAALGRGYHEWSWRSQSLVCQGMAMDDIYCCKYDPKGELLLLGTEMKRVEIHDSALNKRVSWTQCRCRTVEQICCITAIDWSPTGNSFVTGCSNGMLCANTRQGRLITNAHLVPNAILVVRVSPDARTVAAAHVNGRAAYLLSWPSLKMIFSYCGEDNAIVRALTWHPWRSALLGIGKSTANTARIALWDAATYKLVDADLEVSSSISLDAMLFSHRTGELVVSLWRSDPFPNTGSRLVVLSDLGTVVDRCNNTRIGMDHMRTMVFSPDGTKLATATADEDLITWNFLPESKIKKNKNFRRFSAMPTYLDETTYGFSLR